MKKNKCYFYGFLAGLLNGILGAGGGMIIVPILKKYIDDKKAHATTVAIIFPICLISALCFLLTGRVNITEALPYMFFGIFGALIGTFFLCKINKKLLSKIFALLIIWAGIRLLLK